MTAIHQVFETEISRAANNGKGVGTAPDGKTVFICGAVPGDHLKVEVTAARSSFYEAEILRILSPSPDRIAPDCPEEIRCGGCCFRQMTYESELAAKQDFVYEAFRRIGGFEISAGSDRIFPENNGIKTEPILPSPQLSSYRNKAEFAVGEDPDGNLFAGFYSEKTHRVIPVSGCRIIPEEFLKISEYFLKEINLKEKIRHGMKGIPEDCAERNRRKKGSPSGKFRPDGFLHHLVLRRSGLTGEIMLVIAASAGSAYDADIAVRLRRKFSQVTSVILNSNPKTNGPVLGTKNRVLSGSGFIRDRICGVPIEIGPLSFFQVNTPAAENLYRTVSEFAGVCREDVILDLYCGMGTIGLSMAADCRQLIGGEIVPEAVESAGRNAAAMGIRNSRFLCGDAADIAHTLIREDIHPNLIILDPPRRGCSPETLQAVKTLAPDRIVMVSCDPATAARDCRILCESGWIPIRLRPADLFPRTKHVETVVLLSKEK